MVSVWWEQLESAGGKGAYTAQSCILYQPSLSIGSLYSVHYLYNGFIILSDINTQRSGLKAKCLFYTVYTLEQGNPSEYPSLWAHI